MSADPQPLFFILVTSRAVWKLLKVVFVDDKIKNLNSTYGCKAERFRFRIIFALIHLTVIIVVTF